MKYTEKDYNDLIVEVTEKVPFMETKQLKRMLLRAFELDEKRQTKALRKAQRDGHIVMSESGYVLTKRYYDSLTGDQFDDGLTKNEPCYLKETVDIYREMPYEIRETLPILDAIKKEDPMADSILELKNAMWVIADLMPQTRKFIVAHTPWTVMAEVRTSDNVKKILEILVVTDRNEDIRLQMFDNTVAKEKLNGMQRRSLMRIAIIDDPEHTYKIGRVGFSNIVTINSEKRNGYDIIEQRDKDEVWADARN